MSKKFLSPIKLAQGASVPASGSAGELFYNTTDLKVYSHNGTAWVATGGGVTNSATAPSTPANGDAWFNTNEGRLFIYYADGTSGQWVESVPATKSSEGYQMPAGAIMAWGAAVAPVNWLICDGSAISRATYASLFASIGTTYGVGDGSTTFNLPNLKGRVVTGLDSAQTEFDTLGEIGGAKTHTLTVSEMPSHTHQISVGSSADWNDYLAGSTSPYGIEPNYSGTGYSSPLSSVGGGGAHNNLQPYIVLNYIIKTSAGVTAGDSELATRVGAVETTNSSMTGAIMSFAKSTAPGGWLIADGSALSRGTYADLFAAIGTTYGAGNGSTTFNLPDLRGRVSVGKNTGTFATLGGTGGAETHTLSTTEIPSHTHTEDYLYYQPNFTTIPAGSNYPVAGAYTPSQSGTLQRSSDPTGGGGAHNNLQPYITLLYCIKY